MILNTLLELFSGNRYIYILYNKQKYINMPSGIKMTLEDFINRANKAHNNKYSYDLIEEFKGCRVKLPVICPTHGIFWTVPYSHIQGKGCPKCANERQALANTYTTEEWIEKAKGKYGERYDYSKVDMEHRRDDGKVCIICHEKDEFGEEHGEFWMDPKIHLYKQGCPKCGGTYHYTREEWIEKAKKNHPLENYDFSKVKYINNSTKVCIICPEHGEFWRNPKTFLYSKTGCPFCSTRSLMEEDITLLLTSEGINFIKQVTRKFFKWLDNLRLDFYLPDYNIAIECQGEQHFKPIDFAGKGIEWATKLFEENRMRDKKKKDICEENGIKLLYFAKKEFENYDNIITDKEELLNTIYNNKL